MTDAGDERLWSDEDLAIAGALGVEVPDDAATVDAGAVADYETVLSALPFDAVAPRSELEDDVIAAALARRPAAATAIDGRRARRRRVSPRWIAIAGTAAAAAAIAFVLAIGGPSNGPGAPGGRIVPAASTDSVTQVIADTGTRTAVLHTDAERPVVIGRVALGADGQGFLYDLTPAQPDQARWLWLDSSGEQILVGRFTGNTVHFVVRGDVSSVTGVVVTPERVLISGPGRADAVLEPPR